MNSNMQTALGFPIALAETSPLFVARNRDFEYIMCTFSLCKFLEVGDIIHGLRPTKRGVCSVVSDLVRCQLSKLHYTQYLNSFIMMTKTSKKTLVIQVTDVTSRWDHVGDTSRPFIGSKRHPVLEVSMYNDIPRIKTERCMATTTKKTRCKRKGRANAFGYICHHHNKSFIEV